jgi:hypothetical protein
VEGPGGISAFGPHAVKGLNGLGGRFGYQEDMFFFQVLPKGFRYTHTAGVSGTHDKDFGRCRQNVVYILSRQAVTLAAPPVAIDFVPDDLQIVGISSAADRHMAPGGITLDHYLCKASFVHVSYPPDIPAVD